MEHHFYTTNQAEGDRAGTGGFQFEGTAAFVFPTQQPGTVQMLRSFNGEPGDGGDHFYTTDVDEQARAVSGGWKKENTVNPFFVFDPNQPQPDGTVPLVRFYNNSISDHFYTIDPNGEDAESRGWQRERISCFVFDHQEPGTVPLRRYWKRGTNFGDDLGNFLDVVEGVITVVAAAL